MNNKISAFHYYAIPHNIARLLNIERKYEESLGYVNKAIEYINKEQAGTAHKMYILELKALNFHCLLSIDSALYYYNAANEIANNINDATSRSRIDYNIFALLYSADDYASAEQKCKEIILSTHSTDSINLGRLNLVLATIYNKSGKIDSAALHISEAKKLLVNAEYATQRYLYNILSKVEKSKGNEAKAAQYLEHREKLKTEHENAKKQEVSDIHAEVEKLREDNMAKVVLFAEQSHASAKKEAIIQIILFSLLGLCIVAIGILFYKVRAIKMDVLSIKEIFDYGKETMVRQINQRRDLFDVLEHATLKLEHSPQHSLLVSKIENLIPKPSWSDKPPQIYFQYWSMFERFQTDFTMLSEMEYRILCMLCILDLTDEPISYYLLIEDDEFEEIKASMIEKLKKEGYSLNRLINETRSRCKLKLQNKLLN